MSNFTTGLFALTGAFGGIYLKDYLEQKNKHKQSIRQKAVEAYALTSKIPYTLTYLFVLCKNSITNQSTTLQQLTEHENESSNILEKLDLLIIENFYTVSSDLLLIKSLIHNMNSLLLKNIIEKPSITEQELEFEWQNFTTKILASTAALNTKLLQQFINIDTPKANLYLIIKKHLDTIIYFFSKP
jgi:hypothetical protein